MRRDRVLKALWTLALWLLGAVVAARAAEEAEWRVTLDIQMVAISSESALKLLPRLREPATFDKAFAEIQQMIERDEADLVAWPVIVAPHSPEWQPGNPEEIRTPISARGEPTTSESVLEERYPTEFLPPEETQIFGPPLSLPRLLLLNPGFVTTPTAFETRNLGVTVTAEAVASKGGAFVQLSVRPKRTLLLEYQTMRSLINPSGIEGIFPVPQFQIAQVNSHLTVRNGKRMLLGTFVEEKPAAKVLLFLLKAVAVRTGNKSIQP